MLGRWDERQKLSSEKLFRTCERLAQHIATFMIDNGLLYISEGEARGMIRDFLGDRNIGVTEPEAFEYLLDRSNIFGRMAETDAIFFRHRSFAEYLYAQKMQKTSTFTVDERAFQPYWLNIYFFYFGLLTECPEHLQALIELETADDRQRWFRLLQFGNYLLAAYQSPYSLVERALLKNIIDIARLFLDIRSGKTTSAFRNLSEMTLLWLFAGLVKHCLAYEFFHKALPNAILDIDQDQTLSEEEKIYSQFFVACALGELGDSQGFEFMLKNYKTDVLPLPVSIGIHCEAALFGGGIANNPHIKRHHKRLLKLLKSGVVKSIGVHDNNQRLDKLFKTPLSFIKPSSQTPTLRVSAESPKRVDRG
jgi:hypothetical protein